ncbi:coiled-coil domain-containing protein 115 [Leptinotarsa decemlineata]|uniref:coiled-coil domain-containing protein 115 n=1 Tax=Leptinotarsa decemlineata TaxID=7539 RepID=UPI003D306B2E
MEIKMTEATEDLDKVCNILDKLTLDALLLTQEEIHLKLNIENAMCEGETNLAKARYIIGHNNVSSIQLPTEDSPKFSAVVKIVAHDESWGRSYDLKQIKKSDDESVQEPLRWFGFLVPQSLNRAQNMFRQAIQWSIQAVNIQTRLEDTVNTIHSLKNFKLKIQNK